MESTNRKDREEIPRLWPELPYPAWRETRETLHQWTQIVGKVRLELSSPINHWWHVPFYVTARGLTTSTIPYHDGGFEVIFDFTEHTLHILTSEGTSRAMPLIPRSVATFYREFMACLRALGIEVTINTLPSEIQNPIPCDEDELHASYDHIYARRFWRILVQTDSVLKRYRSFFLGKSSPVHFFWGSFDVALTFFSGRRAPLRPGADLITREAYSHEVISCGFWSGNEQFQKAAFYSYTAPSPPGLELPFFAPILLSIALNYLSSSCCMMMCGNHTHQDRHRSISFTVRMRLERRLPGGIVSPLNVIRQCTKETDHEYRFTGHSSCDRYCK